ncbi:MAG TPA: DsbA family protein [Gemmatimonadota bacterium]|nr:DsbA family protein [Gemmatimonadota bacterium]
MPVSAFLYGHYACPHTYIAQGRLDLLASEAPVTVTWRPLPPAESAAADAAAGVEVGWQMATEPGVPLAETLQALRRDAAALGLTLSLPATPPDPRTALHATEFAADCGPAEFARLHRALFRAVFVDGRDIEQRDVIIDLAVDVGLDAEGLGAALDDGRYEQMLRDVEAEAARYQIDATPTILIGRFKLVGAAPLDVLGSTLERALEADG